MHYSSINLTLLFGYVWCPFIEVSLQDWNLKLKVKKNWKSHYTSFIIKNNHRRAVVIWRLWLHCPTIYLLLWQWVELGGTDHGLSDFLPRCLQSRQLFLLQLSKLHAPLLHSLPTHHTLTRVPEKHHTSHIAHYSTPSQTYAHTSTHHILHTTHIYYWITTHHTSHTTHKL